MVPVLNWKGEYRGIFLVEVAWKVCAEVVNWQGTEMDILEAKLEHQLYRFSHKPLFQVFLDAWKAYNSLDMGRCLEVLRGEGLGPNMARLVTSYWYQQRIVSKSGKFLGKYFWAGRGVTQGDPMSPMFFNIVVYAVVRAFLDVVCGTQEAQHVLGWLYGEKNLVFYANDGKIVGQDHKWV